MRFALLRGVLLLLAFASALAQARRPTGGLSGTPASGAGGRGNSLPPDPVYLSGKVTLDGAELTEPAAIQIICGGRRHTEAYTNSRGRFNFQFADLTTGSAAGISDASAPILTRSSSALEQRNWQDCQLQAVLAGFSSDPIELRSRMHELQSTEFGRVPLQRLEHVEGTSISVTSALAPPAAQKALAIGREDERKGKWDKAQNSLEKAVQIYPKYAMAWNELGRVQMHNSDPNGAKRSFEQALAADSQYVNPYSGLAQLALQGRQWQEVVEATDKLLALNAVNFPDAYFMNGVGNYNLQNLEAAERSARQGIRVDQERTIPELHYLLGTILVRKHDYQGASQQLQIYLQLAKKPTEIDAAKKQLAEISRLSTSVNPVAADEKR